jgi:hypothetical protein
MRQDHSGDEEMQASIGTQQQWGQIDTRLPGAIEVVNRYSDLTGKILRESVPLNGLPDKIIFGLSRVCIEESQEILLLAANEYPSGASKLLRGLYERTVTVLYLKKHPEKAERFQHYAAIQEHRVLAAARKLFSDEQLNAAWKTVRAADIEASYVKFKAEFQRAKCKTCKTTELAHSWDVDLGTMADRVGEGMPDLYLSSYTVPTLHAHATFASAYVNIAESEDRVVYSFKHAHAEVDLCIIQVFTLIHRIFDAAVNVFGLPFGDDVETFGRSLEVFLQRRNVSADAS